MLPDNRQKGRADVVAAYASQFAASQNSSYELSDIEVSGGPVGRLTARYRTGSATGDVTFTVIRERSRPRITMIAADPDS